MKNVFSRALLILIWRLLIKWVKRVRENFKGCSFHNCCSNRDCPSGESYRLLFWLGSITGRRLLGVWVEQLTGGVALYPAVLLGGETGPWFSRCQQQHNSHIQLYFLPVLFIKHSLLYEAGTLPFTWLGVATFNRIKSQCRFPNYNKYGFLRKKHISLLIF